MKIKQYLIPVIRDDDLPPELAIAVRVDNIERLKRAWKNANNPHFLFRSAMNGDVELIGIPSSVYHVEKYGNMYYVLRFPSTNVYVDARMVTDELAEQIQSELLRVVVRKQGKIYIAVSVEPLIATPKEERGKELVEVAESDGIPIWEIPVIGYGYISKSTKELFNSNAPDEALNRLAMFVNLRFITTLKVMGQVIHGIELSTPNTGKTSFAVRNVFLFRWYYINEPPSFARIIMDARTSSLGAVFRSDGLFIDEIDKYAKELREIISALLSGMSNGIWKRAKGDRDTPNIRRFIPIYFAGNRINKSLSKLTPRQYIKNVLSARLPPSEVEALMDRISVAITNENPVNASDYVSKFVIPDSYLRGFNVYISKKASKAYKDLGLFSGRMREQANILNAVCEAMNLSTNCDEFAKGVETGWEI
jgi:hypothetical protein